MRELVLFFFSLLFSGILHSQNAPLIRDTSPAMDSGLIDEHWPTPPQASYNLNDYFVKNMQYPKGAKDSGISGCVYVSFFVEKDGSITNVTIKKSSGNISLDNEALRVASSLPPWYPGIDDGKPVRVEMVQPIRFALPVKSSQTMNDTAYHGDSDLVYSYVEEMPTFPGGNDSMLKYIQKHFNYPPIDRDNFVGITYVSFVIERDGHISNVAIRKSCGNANMDERVLTLFREMPPWIPGKQDGKIVRTKIIEPFRMGLR